MPDGGWRPPLEDGDEDDLPPTRYAGILTSLGPMTVQAQSYGSAQPLVEEEEDGGQSSENGGGAGATSSHSRHSSLGHYPYMTGFGQAAESLQGHGQQPVMTMADSAVPASGFATPLVYSPTPGAGGPDPASWFGGKDFGYESRGGRSPSIMSSSHGHSSQEKHGKERILAGSKTGSSDDEPFSAYHMPSSSQTHASSCSEIGSSSGHRRSVDVKRQGSIPPVPPTSFSYHKGSNSEHGVKAILGRLRGGRGPSPPAVAEVFPKQQEYSSPPRSPPPSSLRHHRHSHNNSRSISPTPTTTNGPPVIGIRAPTPPSSLLRPQSPTIPNMPIRPTLILPNISGERSWQGELTLPPLPSPAVSEVNIAVEGLLDPRLPWRLEQGRVDSTASLRDHEDYSRPLGEMVRFLLPRCWKT